jgi:phosphatidylinositol glycan class B
MKFLQELSFRNIWLAGILIHCLAAWFSVGYYHADEHFQLLEYVSYKTGHTDLANLPWEYQAGMRPSLQVFISYLVRISLGFLDAFNIAFILRLLSVGLALISVFFTGKWFFREEAPRKIYYLCALFLWFMPYQYARFSSENWSAIMMLLAVAMTIKNRSNLLVGVFCGLSFCFRYQSAFFISGLFFWLLFIKKQDIKQLGLMVSGFVLIFMLGVLSDHWLYGKWVLSSYEYFYINLVQGKAAEFGTEPFYYYLIKISESAIFPIGLLLIYAFIRYVVREPKSIFTWVAVPFFVLHCAISHKELRFLFPLVYFIPIALTSLFMHMGTTPGLRFRKAAVATLSLLVVLNFLFLPVSSFKASNPRIALLKHLKNETQTPVCYKENPYFSEHWFSFYFPEHFDARTLTLTEDTLAIPAGEQVIIPSFSNKEVSGRVIYRQIPPAIENVNYGHWLERSNLWCIAIKQ